ncbi:hypothetical protein EW146_g5546 [Bondarzewia mesenterica]|uniref:AAA+ ATPase domain-containing protein n=1 Tax=Bondarzewia mesenterica TaxID=1095465 RepID=A0A4S4LS87_9AGAM|nr:hypothetical protein EW146_g5546 [Bondarzewia mesenterica]
MPPQTARSRQNKLKLDAPPPLKKFKALHSERAKFASPPRFDLGHDRPTASPLYSGRSLISSGKLERAGKGTAKVKDDGSDRGRSQADDRLWVDQFEPRNAGDLAVHKRKVEDVRRWLVESVGSGKLEKYRRLLVLTGPAGSAKTATIRVLARELGIEILEWRNSPNVPSSSEFPGGGDDAYSDYDYESAMDKFEAFLARAGSYRSLFAPVANPIPSQSLPSASQSATTATGNHQLILLEDLPNVLHPAIRERFHGALRVHIESVQEGVAPVVVVLSDAGLRGENGEERWVGSSVGRSEGGGKGKGRAEVVDFRTVIPPGLGAAWITQIEFNPVAQTFLTAALKVLLARANVNVSSKLLEAVEWDGNQEEEGSERASFPSRSLIFTIMLTVHILSSHHHADFHAQVRSCTGKGDPPSTSASAKDKAAERDMDATLKDPKPLPVWLKDEERRASRVDVDMLYADTPIDASLFGLYIHQNYTQFCDEVEQCDGVVDGLSWLDANGGESWYQTNPYSFHMQTLSTLHALPSPVPRRKQKFWKPEFFESLKKENEAGEAVERVRVWLNEDSHTSLGDRWSRISIATELGAVLKALDCATLSSPQLPTFSVRPPREHTLFSEMVFTKGAVVTLAEEGEQDDLSLVADGIVGRGVGEAVDERVHAGGGELDEDGIEDW